MQIVTGLLLHPVNPWKESNVAAHSAKQYAEPVATSTDNLYAA